MPGLNQTEDINIKPIAPNQDGTFTTIDDIENETPLSIPKIEDPNIDENADENFDEDVGDEDAVEPAMPPPKEESQPTTPKLVTPTGLLPWSKVAKKTEYKDMSPQQRTAAKFEYFETVVAPNLEEGDYASAQQDFLNYTSRVDYEADKPSFYTDVVLDSLARLPKRAAGVLFGTMSAPVAAIWGGTRELARKDFDSLTSRRISWREQLLHTLGAMVSSASSAAFSEGEWGVRYNDYFKEMTGKTIEETLPPKFKWLGPTLEFLAEASTDPLLVEGMVGDFFTKGIPKEFMGRVPKKLVDDLNRYDKLKDAEKIEAQQQFLSVLNNRKVSSEGYIKFWNDTIDKMDKKGPSLLKPGERSVPDLKAAQNAMAGQPVRDFAIINEREVALLTQQIDEAKILGKLRTGSDQTLVIAERKVNEFRRSKGLGPMSRVPKEEIVELRKATTVESLNKFRVSKGLPKIEMNAAGGFFAGGYEEDEEGNMQFNWKGALAGTALVLAGMGKAKFDAKKAQRATATLMDNPNWAKVSGTVGKVENVFTTAGLVSKLNTNLFDRFNVLSRHSIATYEAARVFSAYKDQSWFKFQELQEAFKPVAKQEVAVSDYINARRLESRARSGVANPGGVTLAEAKQAQKEIEDFYYFNGGNVDDLKNAAGSFDQWTKDYILKEALDSGVINKEAYNAIIKNNSFYATFEVLDNLPADINNAGVGGEYFSVGGQKVIQKMTGTEKQIADPMESTIKKFTQAQALFARNKVVNTFINDPQVSKLLRPVAGSAEEFAIMKNSGLDPVAMGSWNKKEFDTISRMKDGRVEKFLVDKDIADAMKQLTPFQAPKFVHAMSNLFRKSATNLYVPFTISNAFRDSLMAYTTSPVYKTQDLPKFAKDWVGGFWDGLKFEFGKSDIVEEYIKSGGGFGYTGELNKAEPAKKLLFEKDVMGKTVDIAKTPLDLIEKFSGAVELSTRMAVYKRAKIQGLPSGDAALLAKAGTIDFNRGGVYTKVVNQFVPFLNARVQSRVVLAEALKRDPKGTMAKGFVSTVLPGTALYAWNRLYYSALYDDIPEYIKQNYFTFITGSTVDDKGREKPEYFVIPKGDIGQMTFNPIEFAFDRMHKEDPQSTKAFLVNYLSDLSPVEFARNGEASLSKAAGSLLPPIVKGVAEDWANLSFYKGTEIVPYYMGKTKPPELQYTDNTPETYKWIGKKTGIAPLRLQNFASNLLAGYGREGLDPTAMLRGLTGRVIKTTGGEKEQQAWTPIKDIEQGYTDVRAYAQEMAKEGDNQGALKLIEQWNAGIYEQANQFNSKFTKYGIEDRGGIVKSYSFSKRKMQNIIRGAQKDAMDTRTPLNKKLQPRRAK